jgi:hypothetical protein
MKFHCITASLVITCAGCSIEPGDSAARLASIPVEPSSSGQHSIVNVRTKSGFALEVDATSEEYREASHGRIRLDGEVPGTVLSSLTVIIDGRDFSPPESEYSRFGDPVALGVEEDSHGVIYFYLFGGDGGGSHGRRLIYGRSGWLGTQYRDYFTGEYKTPNKSRHRIPARAARCSREVSGLPGCQAGLCAL